MSTCLHLHGQFGLYLEILILILNIHQCICCNPNYSYLYYPERSRSNRTALYTNQLCSVVNRHRHEPLHFACIRIASKPST